MADGIESTLRPAAVQGSPHAIWLRYGGGTVLARPEQLRFATEDELITWDRMPADQRGAALPRGPRGFLDVRREGLEDGAPEDPEAAALPGREPTAATAATGPRPEPP
eukprot:531309-Pyramimonas_sp.AAC.1